MTTCGVRRGLRKAEAVQTDSTPRPAWGPESRGGGEPRGLGPWGPSRQKPARALPGAQRIQLCPEGPPLSLEGAQFLVELITTTWEDVF